MNNTLKSLVVSGLTAALLTTTMVVATPSASAQGVTPLDTSALDTELDRYWKPQVRKPVRQHLFDKDGRHEFTIFTGVVPNDSFFSYLPFGGRWDMYLSDAFGIEVFGSYWLSLDGDLKGFLVDNNLYPILTEFPQQLLWNAAAAFVWTPIHGKVAVFTTKLFHFDFNAVCQRRPIITRILGKGRSIPSMPWTSRRRKNHARSGSIVAAKM